MSEVARLAPATAGGATPKVPLRHRLAARGFDNTTLLVVPAALLLIALFVYPFLYGLFLSFTPMDDPDTGAARGALANYINFFTDKSLYGTIATTLWLSVPVTLLNVALAVPIALRVRLMRRQRWLTTILVVPITLGTVLVAEGLSNYLGPQGWLNRTLLAFHLVVHPLQLLHNYWGVFLSLLITGFPFTFLLALSYITGVDPSIEKAAATLGAHPAQRFRHILLPLILPGLTIAFCLSFVQAFAVFPSAILLGAPAGPTRVISIAAYDAAFEQYDYPLASAIAMVMGFVQLAIVAALLWLRGFAYRGPAGGGKG